MSKTERLEILSRRHASLSSLNENIKIGSPKGQELEERDIDSAIRVGLLRESLDSIWLPSLEKQIIETNTEIANSVAEYFTKLSIEQKKFQEIQALYEQGRISETAYKKYETALMELEQQQHTSTELRRFIADQNQENTVPAIELEVADEIGVEEVIEMQPSTRETISYTPQFSQFIEKAANLSYPFISVLQEVVENGFIERKALKLILGDVRQENFVAHLNKLLRGYGINLTLRVAVLRSGKYSLESDNPAQQEELITQLRESLPAITQPDTSEVEPSVAVEENSEAADTEPERKLVEAVGAPEFSFLDRPSFSSKLLMHYLSQPEAKLTHEEILEKTGSSISTYQSFATQLKQTRKLFRGVGLELKLNLDSEPRTYSLEASPNYNLSYQLNLIRDYLSMDKVEESVVAVDEFGATQDVLIHTEESQEAVSYEMHSELKYLRNSGLRSGMLAYFAYNPSSKLTEEELLSIIENKVSSHVSFTKQIHRYKQWYPKLGLQLTIDEKDGQMLYGISNLEGYNLASQLSIIKNYIAVNELEFQFTAESRETGETQALLDDTGVLENTPLLAEEATLPTLTEKESLEMQLGEHGITKEVIAHFAAFLSINSDALRYLYEQLDKRAFLKDISTTVSVTDEYLQEEQLKLNGQLDQERQNAIAALLRFSSENDESGSLLHRVFRNQDMAPYYYSVMLTGEMESMLTNTVEYENLSAADMETFGSRLAKYVHDYSHQTRDYVAKLITVLAEQELPHGSEKPSRSALILKQKMRSALTAETPETAVVRQEEDNAVELLAATEQVDTSEIIKPQKESREEKIVNALWDAVDVAKGMGLDPYSDRFFSITEILAAAGYGKLYERNKVKIEQYIPTSLRQVTERKSRTFYKYKFGALVIFIFAVQTGKNLWQGLKPKDKHMVAAILESEILPRVSPLPPDEV